MYQPSSEPSPSAPPTKCLSDLQAIMSRLRGPDGCPWDREQTSQSLKPHLLEEVYEVLEAIDTGKPSALKEELGDLLLQIVFHTQIASEQNQFSFDDVANGLADKLIRRHPHVFQQTTDPTPITTAQDVSRQWDQLKQQEQATQPGPQSLLQGVPKIAPALQRAFQVQKRASRGGFDWERIEPALEKFQEELNELYAAVAESIPRSPEGTLRPPNLPVQHTIEEELGDAFFALVNVSRFLRVNPEEALRRATNKFISRFHFVESQATLEGKDLRDYTLPQLDKWWDEAKHLERQAPQTSESIKGAKT
ncbi:MAG: nucleoside triphosphate pyrophosphohydrolase [Nitrospirales bacterium]|nr:nucleoside triphosphate pyrophosphohydrolase [Nitrospirales bacterium]MBA3965381.1 nucleoside triphosphate pyrophosphohydrolase [Nitrospirales bacterium]